MMRKIFATFLTCTLAIPQYQWAKSQQSGFNWKPQFSVYNPTDNTIVFGADKTTPPLLGVSDAVIITMDTAGTIISTISIGEIGWNYGVRGIRIDPRDSSVYISLFQNQICGNTAFNQACLRKYDRSVSTVLWQYCWVPPTSTTRTWTESDFPVDYFSLVVDPVSNVVGMAFNANAAINDQTITVHVSNTAPDCFVALFNATTGARIWVNRISYAQFNTGACLVKSLELNSITSRVTIVGHYFDSCWNPFTKTYSLSGALVGEFDADVTYCTGVYGSALSPDQSRIYITGDTWSDNLITPITRIGDSNDIYGIALDSSTSAYQSRTVQGTTGEDLGRSVATIPDYNGVVFLAETSRCLGCTSTKQDIDLFLFAMSPDLSGQRLWTSQFGTSVDDEPKTLLLGQNGAIFVFFSTIGTYNGQTGNILVKLFESSLNVTRPQPTAGSVSKTSSTRSSSSVLPTSSSSKVFYSAPAMPSPFESQTSAPVQILSENALVPTTTDPTELPSRSETINRAESARGIASTTKAQNITEKVMTALGTSRETTIILVVLIAVILIILTFIATKRKWLKHGLKRTSRSSHKASTSSTKNLRSNHVTERGVETNFSHASNTSTMKNTTTMHLNDSTVVPTSIQNVLAIPAYLSVSRDHIKIESKLKSGGGGAIYLAKYDNQPVALKEFLNVSGHVEKIGVYQEIGVTHFLSKEKNFVKFLAFCEEPLSMVLKFYPLGTLTSIISKPRSLTKQLILNFIHDISSALTAMNVKGLVHCDMKPDNALIDVDRDGTMFCVLTDFGITQVVTSMSLGVKVFRLANIRGGSYPYASPEVFQRKMFEHQEATVIAKSDVHSFGATLYHVLCKRCPWKKNH